MTHTQAVLSHRVHVAQMKMQMHSDAVINLILHQVPQYCHLSVDGQFHLWFHGKCLIFDDFLLHSAHNETLDDEDSTRVVLLLDFWHPSIDESVKPLLSHIFQRSAE